MSFLLLEAVQLVKYFGDRKILEIPLFQIYEGDRIGVIGANGSGKTTLLHLLSGALQPDEGSITRRQPITYLRQFREGTQPAQQLLLKEFGVTEAAKRQGQKKVSGGEDVRLRIAEAFSQEGTLLFADEPTSNLDTEGVELFCKKMEQVPSFLLISHDRAVLERLCNQIVEVRDGEIQVYHGGYSFYAEESQRRREYAQFAYEQYRQEKNRLEQALVSRQDKASSMRKAPKRMGNSEARLHKRAVQEKQEKVHSAKKAIESRLNRLEVKEKPRELPTIALDFSLTNPPENKVVIRGRDLTFGYEQGERKLFEQAEFEIPNGKKTALYGKNGVGKSTLLELIVQGHPAIYQVPKAKIGCFRQDLAQLKMEKTVLENVMAESIQNETAARTILARLLIKREDVYKPVSVLSGGERIKLAFAKLLVSDANVLFLDEPTNYLDMPSIEALQELLQEYEGTVVFVSHDRAFVEAVADRLLLPENGKLTTFEGKLSQYQAAKAKPKQREEKALERSLLQMKLTSLISRISGAPPQEKDRLEAEYQEILEKLKQLPGSL